MSKHKSSSSNQKQKHEKGVELQRANQRIEELQKEKESLKQLLIQYQRGENKSNLQNDAVSSNYASLEGSQGFKDYQKGYQQNTSHYRLQSQGDQVSQTTIEKGGIQSNSTIHERIKSSQPYEEYSRKNNYQRSDNYDHMTLKTENVKEEVLRLGQTMEELYKKIEGYEKVHAMNRESRKAQYNQSKERKGKSYQDSHHSHNTHHHHHNRYGSRKSPKKSYESTDSEDYRRAVGDFSSSSSCNDSNSSLSKDSVFESSSRDSSNCSKCQHHSNSKAKKQKKKHSHHQKEKPNKANGSNQHYHSNSNSKNNLKQKEDRELEEEALNLLSTIQSNPQTKLAFIQKFGNEELFLDTLKKSKNNKALLVQIIRMMLEILNGGSSDFSQQLYAQNAAPSLHSSNIHKKSSSNSQVIVSPINLPYKPSSSQTQYMTNLNISNQLRQQSSLESSQQYTGENLIKILEQKIYNPNNINVLQQSSLLRNNSQQSQNPMLVQSNIQLNGSFQQNPLTTDQLQSSQLSSNLGQSRFGLLSYYPEKPKTQFQVELREIQNREALLKMQEYETQIETLESKLKNLRGRVEEDNKKRAQDEADRLKRQQEDYQRRKAEQEQEEILRKQKIELEKQRKEQEERDKLRREKDEYERKLQQYKDEEERRRKEDERERDRQREKEEEELRKQREKDEDDRLKQLKEQDELRKKKKREEEEERKRRQRESESSKERETQEYEDNYKVVPDYMKPTKNRCSYVKDVQKDYLRRSNSMTPSNSNTPKSGAAGANANNILNPNWEKVLTKFQESQAQDFSDQENSPTNLEEPNSALKPKSTFARQHTPTKNSSFHKIDSSHKLGGDTPKSVKNKSSNPGNSNFSSMAKAIFEPK